MHVLRVENRGLLFTDNQAGVSGTDSGYSIPMGSKTLWLFGDVFLTRPGDPTGNYTSAVSNCALLVSTGSGTAPLHKYAFLPDARHVARQVLANVTGETNKVRIWPMGGWYSAADHKVYLYYAHITTTGGGALDFRLDGHGMACADTLHPNTLQFRRIPATNGGDVWWKPAAEMPVFGSAVVTGPTGRWLYVVGVREHNRKKLGVIARVLKSRIADLSAYEYYAGGGGEPTAGTGGVSKDRTRQAASLRDRTRQAASLRDVNTPLRRSNGNAPIPRSNGNAPLWSSSLEAAANVEGLTDFPSELSIAYNSVLGGYLAVHSVGITDRIRISLAQNPWGPYVKLGEIGAPHKAFAHSMCYAGKEHAELQRNGGLSIYVTYVDSDRYWLHMLKVTFGQ